MLRGRRSALVFVLLIVSTLLYLLFHRRGVKTTASDGAKIAKVTVAVNSLSTNDAIARCLNSHAVQNSIHGYQHYILTKPLVQESGDTRNLPPGVWSKPAYILHILLSELLKPEEERLSWLFWFDADTLVLNPHIRLETFLPPKLEESATSHIHLILGENWDGINNGAFLLRVHPWSISLLTAHFAFQTYHSDDWLPHREQSAMSYLIHTAPEFVGNWTVVPFRWFNSFPVNGTYSVDIHEKHMDPSMLDNGESHVGDSAWKVVKGDMLVHFAGFGGSRDSWILPWADRAEQYLKDWSSPRYQNMLRVETGQFWEKWSAERRSKYAGPEDERNQLQSMLEKWKSNYNEHLLRLSDFDKYEVVGLNLAA